METENCHITDNAWWTEQKRCGTYVVGTIVKQTIACCRAGWANLATCARYQRGSTVQTFRIRVSDNSWITKQKQKKRVKDLDDTVIKPKYDIIQLWKINTYEAIEAASTSIGSCETATSIQRGADRRCCTTDNIDCRCHLQRGAKKLNNTELTDLLLTRRLLEWD